MALHSSVKFFMKFESSLVPVFLACLMSRIPPDACGGAKRSTNRCCPAYCSISRGVRTTTFWYHPNSKIDAALSGVIVATFSVGCIIYCSLLPASQYFLNACGRCSTIMFAGMVFLVGSVHDHFLACVQRLSWTWCCFTERTAGGLQSWCS